MSGGSDENVQVEAEPALQTLFTKEVMTQILNRFCQSDLVSGSQESFKNVPGNENKTLELLTRDDILKFDQAKLEALYKHTNISHLCKPLKLPSSKDKKTQKTIKELTRRLSLSNSREVQLQLRRTIHSQKAKSPEENNRDSGRLSTFDGLFVCSKDKDTEGTNRRIEAFVVCEIGQVDALPQVWVLSLLCGGYRFGRVLVESVRYAVACQSDDNRNKFVILEVSNNYQNYVALELYYNTGFEIAFNLMSMYVYEPDVKKMLEKPWNEHKDIYFDRFLKQFHNNVKANYKDTTASTDHEGGCAGFPSTLAMVANIFDAETERKNIGKDNLGKPASQKYTQKREQLKAYIKGGKWDAGLKMLDASKHEFLRDAKVAFNAVAASAATKDENGNNIGELPSPFDVEAAKKALTESLDAYYEADPTAKPDADPDADPDAAATFSGGHNHKHDGTSKSKLQLQRVAGRIRQQRQSQRRKSLRKQSQRTQSRNKQSRRKQSQTKQSQRKKSQRKQSQTMQRPVQRKQSQKQQTQRKKSLKQRSAKHRKSR